MMRAKRFGALLVAIAATLSGGLVAIESTPASAAAVVFTVNSTGDASDASPGNGLCATAGSVCTLRAAFEEVNAGSAVNTYTINFSVAGTTQVGSTDLPALFRTVTIDASTAPGYAVATGPTFTVRCASQVKEVSAYGIAFQGSNSTVRGLRLVNCSTAIITSGTATNLRVLGNQIGNDGSSFQAANAVDLAMGISGSGSVIGGPTPADRNVISGYRITGVLLNASAANTSVQGNFIGTNAAGTTAIKNPNGLASGQTSAGIQSSAAGATITGNLISGNPGFGVSAYEGSTTIKGNLIGTDVTGAAGIGNGSSAVMVWPTNTATIGGTGAGEGNVLAYFVPSATNSSSPLLRVFAGAATVLGNKIGSNATGTAALCTSNGTGAAGVAIEPSDAGVGAQVTLGGAAAGAGNLIAGCSRNVEIAQSTNQPTGGSNVTIQGNKIGTNAAGTAAMVALTGGSLNNAGILVGLGQAVTVGGTAAGAGNLISGNGTGVFVYENASGVKIEGNRIGTNAAGTAAVPNTQEGIAITGSSPPPPQGNGGPIVIGGPAAGAGNVVSGNGKDGMLVAAPATVQGNLVGTNAAGTAAVPNAGTYGVLLNNKDVLFGGTGAGEGNTVSGNSRVGLATAPSIQVPTIYGNRIGTNAAGTAVLPNARDGVVIGSGNTGSFGGTGAGQANTIVNSTFAGVRVSGRATVAVRGNLIHSNGALNIDLFQHGDEFNVGNNDQIHPTLTSTVVGASSTSVSGTVTSDRTGTVLVDVYAAGTCQAAYPSGQAQQFLGTISVPYPVAGAATPFSGPVAKSTVGSVITATSTIAGNGTSQFSTCAPFSDIQLSAKDAYQQAPVGTDVATEITVKNAGPTATAAIAVQVGVLEGEFGAVDEATIDAPSTGTIDPTGLWSIPAMAPGATATVCVRGDIVRSSYIREFGGLPFTVPVSWSPNATLSIGPDIADPYTGNNRAYGYTKIDTLMAGAIVCPLPTLSVDDASLTRPSSGTAPMTFTVRLSAVQNRDVTVRYATANGTAVAVEDYVATSGDLTIPAGQTSKTITVPIVGNQSDEPDKAFTVQLSAPKYARLADATATGTIRANFKLGGCPPGSTSVQRFVCHLYFDALGRTPDAGGFNYWVGKLNKGTSRATMAKSYLTQPESLRKVANRAYVLYLGRNGTNAELSAWATKLKNKTATAQDIRIAVLASSEYFTKTGGTNTSFIQQMFRDVFRRNVDASGLAYWTGQLTSGKTRTNVATRFIAEPEGRRKIVGDIYLRFLRRDPTTAEANGWVNQLAAGKTEVDVGIGLVASTEYFNRPQN